MSPDVAAFLLDLLCRQTLAAGADDLVPTAVLVERAKTELRAQLAGAPVVEKPLAAGSLGQISEES